LQWFDKFPQFLSNPLYIGGDSYSGMIVPTVTSEIARGNFSCLQVSVIISTQLITYLDGYFSR
jgi:serine carboxypeptidase-like clade 1